MEGVHEVIHALMRHIGLVAACVRIRRQTETVIHEIYDSQIAHRMIYTGPGWVAYWQRETDGLRSWVDGTPHRGTERNGGKRPRRVSEVLPICGPSGFNNRKQHSFPLFSSILYLPIGLKSPRVSEIQFLHFICSLNPPGV